MSYTKAELDLLNRAVEGSYTLNDDDTIDVQGNVDLSDKCLTVIPFKFSKISGYFDCSYNQLTSFNGLESLTVIGGSFWCNNNKLTSFNGLDSLTVIGGGIYCSCNQLNSFNGFPLSYHGKLYLGNEMELPKELPKELNVLATIYFNDYRSKVFYFKNIPFFNIMEENENQRFGLKIYF